MQIGRGRRVSKNIDFPNYVSSIYKGKIEWNVDKYDLVGLSDLKCGHWFDL